MTLRSIQTRQPGRDLLNSHRRGIMKSALSVGSMVGQSLVIGKPELASFIVSSTQATLFGLPRRHLSLVRLVLVNGMKQNAIRQQKWNDLRRSESATLKKKKKKKKKKADVVTSGGGDASQDRKSSPQSPRRRVESLVPQTNDHHAGGLSPFKTRPRPASGGSFSIIGRRCDKAIMQASCSPSGPHSAAPNAGSSALEARGTRSRSASGKHHHTRRRSIRSSTTGTGDGDFVRPFTAGYQRPQRPSTVGSFSRRPRSVPSLRRKSSAVSDKTKVPVPAPVDHFPILKKKFGN